jgi:hypothetical protein
MTFMNRADLRNGMIEREGRCTRVEGTMTEMPPTPDTAERAFWSWLWFWLQLLVLGVLAIVGAFAASGGDRPGDYACGMVLSLAAIALAFLRLKDRLDGSASGWGDFVLVGDMWNLALVIPLFTIIGLAGLFIAHAWESGAMHTAGIALFLTSGAIIFLDLKHVFDRMPPSGH